MAFKENLTEVARYDKIPCPDCSSKNNLSVYEKEDEDGNKHYDAICWGICSANNEGFKSAKWLEDNGILDDLGKENTQVVHKGGKQVDYTEQLEEIASYDSRGVRERRIKKKYAEMYGMKVGYDTETGENITEHYYPVTKDGEVTGYFKRELPKKFSAIGDVKDCQLQGQHLFDRGGEYENKANKKFIVVTEGYLDMLAAQQMLHEQSNNQDMYTAVVSLPNGINAKSVKVNYKFLNQYENVIFCVDQDEAGKKGVKELCKALPMGKASTMSFSLKDSCEMLKAGKEKEFYKAFWQKESYSPVGIVDGRGLWGTLTNVEDDMSVPYPWEGLNKLTGGIRTGELVTLTAGCVDAETEFLTPTGWKRIDEYEDGDLVAEFNDDRSISFKKPQHYHKYEADNMYKIKTKYGVDQVLSPEHSVVYLSDKNNICKKPMSELLNAHKNSVRGFAGRFMTTFDFEGGRGLGLSDEAIRVAVAVHADGHFRTQGSNNCIIRIKKDRKKERLVKLLEEAGIDYKRKDVAPHGEGFESFTFKSPVTTKTYTTEWWCASRDQMEVIFDEIFHWDGSYGKYYFSSVPSDVDFMQYVACCLGKRTTVHVDDRDNRLTDKPCYRLQVSGNNTVGIKSSAGSKVEIKEVESSDGYKYCFTTSTGMWVMRRNYRVAITGNSGIAKSTFARKILSHLLETTESNIGGMFLEESIKRTGLSIMSNHADKLFHLPDTEYTPEEFKASFDATLGTGRVFLLDHFGSTDIDTILDNITYFARAANCKYIFLDHISIMVSSGDQGDERKALDEIMTKLRTTVQELDIALIIVSHLKRPSGDIGHEQGAATSLAQLRGSAAIAQLSDIVIGIERNQQHEDELERNTSTLRVLKNRYNGLTSVATRLLYNHATGAIVERHEVDEELDNVTDFFADETDLDDELFAEEPDLD